MVKLSREQWIDIEAAVKFLDFFKSEPYPKLSHQICPRCYDHLRTELINSQHPQSSHNGKSFAI